MTKNIKDRFNRSRCKIVKSYIQYHEYEHEYDIEYYMTSRKNLPALFTNSGKITWMYNSEYNNSLGPAISWINGNLEYWINDIQITKLEAML